MHRSLPTLHRDRGLALIMSLAVLAVLSMVVVTFVKMSKVEATAAHSAVLATDARLLAQGAIERAVGELAETTYLVTATDLSRARWVYRDPVTGEPARYPDCRFELGTRAIPSLAYDRDGDGLITDADRVHGRLVSGVIDRGAHGQQFGARHAPEGHAYLLRIQDAASKLNINTINGTVLNELGRMIRDDVMFVDPIGGKGWDIVRLRRELGRFTNISQLTEVIGPHHIRLLREYLTVHSWIDSKTIGASARPDSRLPHTWRSPRAPVNVNTASRPVLSALISPIWGYELVWETALQTDFTAPSAIDTKLRTPWIGRSSGRKIASALIEARHEAPFRSYGQLEAFLDGLVGDAGRGLADLSKAQVAALKSAFNPNTRLTRFNPNAVRAQSVEKVDLGGTSTELCFCSLGRFEIEAIGIVSGPDGRLLATARSQAAVKVYEIARHTTQADFVSARVDHGRTASYPDAIADTGGAGSTVDGQIEMLSTPDAAGGPSARFISRFERSLDAEVGAERSWSHDAATPTGDAKREGVSPLAGGALNPDGMLTQRKLGQELAYDARSNLPLEKGALEFWVKLAAPGHAGNNESLLYAMNVLDGEGEQREGVALKLFRWGAYLFCERFYWGWSPMVSYSATSPYPLQSTLSTVDISSWRAHEWHHVAIAWHDTLEHRLYIDGKLITNHQRRATLETDSVSLGSNVPADQLTLGGYQFESSRDVTVTGFGPVVVKGTNQRYSNSTIAAFRLYGEAIFPATGFKAPQRFRADSDDSTFWHGAFRFDRPALLGALSWTEYLPRRYLSRVLNGDPAHPDTDIMISYRVDGGAWTEVPQDPALGGDGRGCAIAERWGTLFEYRLAFRNGGRIAPLNVSPVLDDITISYRLARPSYLSFSSGSAATGYKLPPVPPPPPPPPPPPADKPKPPPPPPDPPEDGGGGGGGEKEPPKPPEEPEEPVTLTKLPPLIK